MSVKCIRWGIVSAGKVASDFAAAVSTLSTNHHKTVGVAARDDNRAELLAKKLSICKHYGSYLELAQDADIDTVYVGTSKDQALVSLMMLEHGKHVLCETPGSHNTQQLQEVINKAQEKRLFYMQCHGMVTYPAFKRLEQELAENKIGTPEFIRVDPAFVKPSAAALGVIRALSYTGVFLATKLFGSAETITSVGTTDDNGLDTENTLVMRFKEDKMAVVTSSVNRRGSCDVRIFGSKGSLVSSLWRTYSVIINGHKIDFEMPTNPHYKPNIRPGFVGLVYLAEHVRDVISQGHIQSPLVSHHLLVEATKVVDEARTQMGLK